MWQDLIETLDKLGEVYDNLTALGERKRNALVVIDMKGLSNILFYPYQPAHYANHNYAMADVNINALPRGIIGTCMPSKTATMLNSARPMVVSVELDSEYAKMLSRVELCRVVDADDVQGFADAIRDLYEERPVPDSTNAREVFRVHCSRENARAYVRVLEGLNTARRKG